MGLYCHGILSLSTHVSSLPSPVAGETSYRNKRRNGWLHSLLLHIAVPEELQPPWGEYCAFSLLSTETMSVHLQRSPRKGRSKLRPPFPTPCLASLLLLRQQWNRASWFIRTAFLDGHWVWSLTVLSLSLNFSTWSRTFLNYKSKSILLYKAFWETTYLPRAFL